MTPKELLGILDIAAKLKTNTRHCYTAEGRKESIADHSWRIALMAMLLTDAFPQLDINRVIRMCLIHDLGEAFTGDIPTFLKQQTDEEHEENELFAWVNTFPVQERREWFALYEEMRELKTEESKLYKALDRLEAVISHNESDIKTWLPLEYDLQFTYGQENVAFSPYLTSLKAEIDHVTREKIAREADKG